LASGGDQGRRERRGLAADASAVRGEPGDGIGAKLLALYPGGDGPGLEVLVEDLGELQRSEGRAAVWSERPSRSEGMGDDDDDSIARAATRGMDGGTRTLNMPFMTVTDLVFHPPMG